MQVRQRTLLSGNSIGGFFLDDQADLFRTIEAARSAGLKVLLIGVTFALLDLAEKHPCDLSDLVIMETGGMKGRRHEMIREEVHEILINAFGVTAVHSEYGMTELLSQAYSHGGGLFRQWYLHYFAVAQPDLTWDNPDVHADFKRSWQNAPRQSF